ncbi:MAG TPA: beta-ketoacyl-[acyl-carrier-protein] synthase II [Nitrospirales bacterium]|nr:beta-ketoacyl-[acyl-carrier-protein] synthase II [Nitrospirales bacterium]HIN33940.1 beta-ketoacyl-[acyl-carrier-protein] synthase II [Nitrospirales bacterium]
MNVSHEGWQGKRQPERRVVVTGIGLVTPLGIGIEAAWSAVCKGESAVRRITRFDPTDYPSQIAAEIPDFVPTDYVDKKDVKKMDTFIQYAIAASRMAVDDAQFSISSQNANRIGVVIGSGIGGINGIEQTHTTLQEKGPSRVTPFFVPMVIGNMAAGFVSIILGARGPNAGTVTACATGTHSIGDAYRIIQRGEADAIIAGGTEAAITPLTLAGFAAARALSKRNDAPEAASRPFDQDRDGFVIGEGGGVLFLEELEHAVARGARIYAELVGYGMTADAYHITAPPSDANGAVRCMEQTLHDAGLSPSDIGYINAHATSTMADRLEALAITRVFGESAARIPVSATKSMTGHLLGAAGGVEAAFSILAMQRGTLPPTINLDKPDSEYPLDHVANIARKAQVDAILSNSFGFGGTNACLVFRRYES